MNSREKFVEIQSAEKCLWVGCVRLLIQLLNKFIIMRVIVFIVACIWHFSVYLPVHFLWLPMLCVCESSELVFLQLKYDVASCKC